MISEMCSRIGGKIEAAVKGEGDLEQGRQDDQGVGEDHAEGETEKEGVQPGVVNGPATRVP